MKHVAVCSPDIDKLVYQISCKLGSIGFSKMVEQKYGILSECSQEEYQELKLYLELFKKLSKIEITDNNIDLSFIVKNLQLVNNCEIKENSITNIIERVKDLLQNCSDCNNYTPSILYNINDDWYSTQEYIECLQNEFENNGYIEYINPIVDLCTNLNIDINVSKLCQELIVKLNANKISCELISNINATNICNIIQMDNLLNIDINANKLCDLVLKDIKGELPICEINTNIIGKTTQCEINTNIISNEVNGCTYHPICEPDITCVTPLITITDSVCNCIDNELVQTEGTVNIITNCEDNMLYSINGNSWTNILPTYENIDNVLYYKCSCEDSIHLVFKNFEGCPNNYVNATRLCNSLYNNGYYVSTYYISGNITNLLMGNSGTIPEYTNLVVALYGNLLYIYTDTLQLNTQLVIPTICGEPLIINNLFEGELNPENYYPDAIIDYDCDLKNITIIAPIGYEISSNLLNWQNTVTLFNVDIPVKYFIRDINNIDCIQYKQYVPYCCNTYDCADIITKIQISCNILLCEIINYSGCEYIIDFYVDNIKVHTEGYGSIYDSAVENPYNLTLQNIVNTYCGDINNPVYIYPIIRMTKCQDIICTPLCPLPPIIRTCLSICALPTISAPYYEYETGVTMPNQDISYSIYGDTLLQITYSMFMVSDSIEIYYNNLLVNGAYNLTLNGVYEVPIVYVPNVNTLTIRFIPNQLLPTKARIQVSCLNNSICVPKTDCLSLNVLDYENPIINNISDICYDTLTVTLPITEQGNLYYNNCINYYGSIQSNSVNFKINSNAVCSTNITDSIYLCNINNFVDNSVILSNSNNSRTLFISNTLLYTTVKNYIISHNCNIINEYSYISIDLVNTESTACNKDCVDDINCNIYTVYPIIIYPCKNIVSFNDITNTITIVNGELPEIPDNLCNCEYSQIYYMLQNLNYGNSISYYKTIDRLSYHNISSVSENNPKIKTIYNILSNNEYIPTCTVSTDKYIILYLCENNPINSVRIYRQNNTINNMYALVYQGNITWTDGRTVNSNNYIYTDTQILTNTGNC